MFCFLLRFTFKKAKNVFFNPLFSKLVGLSKNKHIFSGFKGLSLGDLGWRRKMGCFFVGKLHASLCFSGKIDELYCFILSSWSWNIIQCKMSRFYIKTLKCYWTESWPVLLENNFLRNNTIHYYQSYFFYKLTFSFVFQTKKRYKRHMRVQNIFFSKQP